MPAIAQRWLPLMCRGSRDVMSSVRAWVSHTIRRHCGEWNPVVSARSRTERVWEKANRRGTSVGDDWQCTRMCTVTGRNLIDEWKALDWNQR
jgi:hypothetical protein